MIKEMDVQELKAKLDSDEKFYFIDCRELEEWQEGHIEGAALLPLSEFQQRYEAVLTEKDAKIVVQCRSGKRSMNACMFLLSQGYSDLNNVEGGILAWTQAGFPVI
ncbi:rhodanese-like domain-containing protein [Bacteriovorax sp. PP10]|uniref:Rhodanese-like domain-containing protein n=1 Tax=Bacteriovorax antarcticus TaxID=3088717 RepID=A0ABU5VQ60_9BACT|nr:rhodanese-like domain-containing protein [Bacteriovorax sp. PP10]MEA9355180.1 rhodanese-like domain-containing protein [Bacteriovorax sp. PP10]